MMAERGIDVFHTTILRWVQCYAPEFENVGSVMPGLSPPHNDFQLQTEPLEDIYDVSQIEHHIETVEQRDAESFSQRVATDRASGKRRSGHRRSQRGWRNSSGQRRCRPTRDDEQQDDQPRGRFGTLRIGLVITIIFTTVAVLACLVLFTTNSGSRTQLPHISITLPQTVVDPNAPPPLPDLETRLSQPNPTVYLAIQPYTPKRAHNRTSQRSSK
jgi:hypothetical protein